MHVYQNVYRFRYKDKNGRGLGLTIFARSVEIADEIIAINSTCSPWKYVPRRFGFQKKYPTTIPPYELEQEQYRVSMGYLEHRKAYYREHPEEAKKDGISPDEYKE